MQVPYFQLLLSPALLHSCYLLFACSAAAMIFFVLFRYFWICSCLVSLQNANSPDSLPALPLAKFRLSCTAIFTLHCWLWICFTVFCKSSALLIAAGDLSPGLLQLLVKTVLLKGKDMDTA